jgi:transposase-like protein
METANQTHEQQTTRPGRDSVNEPVLHIYAGHTVAECPHCKGELSKKTPIMKGDENEEVRGRNSVIAAMRMAADPRPKCPHCYGRFELVIHLQNESRQARAERVG